MNRDLGNRINHLILCQLMQKKGLMPLTSSIFVSINANRNLFFVSLSPSLFFFLSFSSSPRACCLLPELVTGLVCDYLTTLFLHQNLGLLLIFLLNRTLGTLRNKTPWFDHKLDWFVPWILWNLALFIAKPTVHNSQKTLIGAKHEGMLDVW